MKFVINDKTTGKSYSKEAEQAKITGLDGKRIGDEFDGGIIDIPGYKLKITGGSDKNGFPMRLGIHSHARKKILVASGVGYHAKIKGARKRKSMRGEVIGVDIAQINCAVEKKGKQKLEDLLGTAPKEESEEKKK